jgi:hypothetical protein
VGIGKQCAGGRHDSRREQVLASNALAEEVPIRVCDFWQAVCWCKMRQWKSTAISEECASGRSVMTEACDLLGDKCNLVKKGT